MTDWLLLLQVVPMHEDIQFAQACIARITSMTIPAVKNSAPARTFKNAYAQAGPAAGKAAPIGMLQLCEKIKSALQIAEVRVCARACLCKRARVCARVCVCVCVCVRVRAFAFTFVSPCLRVSVCPCAHLPVCR